MSKKQNIKPMYFSKLELTNIKCFGEKQILDLKDANGAISPWTLILGNNGVGKTTLLKCLGWMETVEETDEKQKKKAKIPKGKIAVKSAMDSLEDDSEYENLSRVGDDVTSIVKAQLTIGTPLKAKPSKEELLEYSITFRTKKGKLEEVTPKLTGVSSFNSPYIYGYNASRHMEIKNTERLDLADPLGNLYSETGELFDAQDQLLNYDYMAIQEGDDSKEAKILQSIKSLLVDLLPGVKSAESIKTHAKSRSVKISTDDGDIPLSSLSLGYKTMVAWVVDLALKMLGQNPDSKDPLKEPAVVIIDEIDLHLHPTWQRTVREKLTETFTKTQFICTAHSPFMAQAAEEENLCVVSRQSEQVKIQNEPHIVKGWRLGQIVTSELFGLESDRSPSSEKIINERRELLDRKTLSNEDKNDLVTLTTEIDKLPLENEEDDQLMRQIRAAASLLKQKGIINDKN